MDTGLLRTNSVAIAANAGILITANLPPLESKTVIRQQDEVLDRLLCLNAVAATAFGFDSDKSWNWLLQEKLDASLTEAEMGFIQQGEGLAQLFQLQVESMWALAWALSLVPSLDFWTECDDGFVHLMPDPRVAQSGDEIRSRAKLRSLDELMSVLDLSYCLHWAIRQAQLERKQPPGGLVPYVVIERRRALEWLLDNESWDAVSLDT